MGVVILDVVKLHIMEHIKYLEYLQNISLKETLETYMLTVSQHWRRVIVKHTFTHLGYKPDIDVLVCDQTFANTIPLIRMSLPKCLIRMSLPECLTCLQPAEVFTFD